ncbi:MAG: hypothetical protein ACI83W_001830 [Marinoscillum sp.]|jgi:hypothetical protein
MDEYFLQYLWKFQKFNTKALKLTNGQSLTVFNTGYQNHHSGPDFHEAKIKIDDLLWSGSVEIHYHASDWIRHQHQTDRAYENVVLHVVWIADREIILENSPIPTLELKNIVSEQLATEYSKYINQPDTIRCGTQLSSISQIEKRAMLDRAIASRLETKSSKIMAVISSNGGDWEEGSYRILSSGFGFKTNTPAFELLTQSLPYSIVRKFYNKPMEMEALIFGMAGFLASDEDPYQTQLKDVFEFQKRKHNLNPTLQRHHWKHSKMRPANFPSVRLAQFAAFLVQNQSIFQNLIALDDTKKMQEMIGKPLSEYWQFHFDFGTPSKSKLGIGTKSIELLMINSTIPLLVAHSKYIDDQEFLERALVILEDLPAERNHILDKWNDLGVKAENAADSQALIEQYNSNCSHRKCLQCNIGMVILNRQS